MASPAAPDPCWLCIGAFQVLTQENIARTGNRAVSSGECNIECFGGVLPAEGFAGADV